MNNLKIFYKVQSISIITINETQTRNEIVNEYNTTNNTYNIKAQPKINYVYKFYGINKMRS